MITLIVPSLKRGITEMRPSVVTAILSSQRIFFSFMRVRQENSPCLVYCTGTVLCTRFLHVKESSLVSNTSRYDFLTYPVVNTKLPTVVKYFDCSVIVCYNTLPACVGSDLPQSISTVLLFTILNKYH